MTSEQNADNSKQESVPARKDSGESKPSDGASASQLKKPNPIIRRPQAPVDQNPPQTEETGDSGSQTAEIKLPLPESNVAEKKPPIVSEQGSPRNRRDDDPSASQNMNVLGSSSQTIHIQLPDELLDRPKKTAGSETAETKAAAPSTVKLKAPPTVKLKPPPQIRSKPLASGMIEAQAKEEGTAPQPKRSDNEDKRGTSRIPLPNVTPPGVPKPGSAPLRESVKPPSPAQAEASKRKTSRISLDAALSGVDEGKSAQSGPPKTIRLKRPVVAASAQQGVDPDKSPGASGQTSKLPDDTDVPESPTQRKTIRVKRPTLSASEGQVSAASESDAQASPVSADAMMSAADTVHPFFALCAVAAILVSLSIIWVLAGHAVGPNKSLTSLSAWPTGPNITPPGLISID